MNGGDKGVVLAKRIERGGYYRASPCSPSPWWMVRRWPASFHQTYVDCCRRHMRTKGMRAGATACSLRRNMQERGARNCIVGASAVKILRLPQSRRSYSKSAACRPLACLEPFLCNGRQRRNLFGVSGLLFVVEIKPGQNGYHI